MHLRNSEVFSEVIPSKIFEAMGMGLPIFAAIPSGEAAELIMREKIGEHILPENPNLLAEYISTYSKKKIELSELSKNSLLAANKYSREKQALDVLEVLEKILK